MRGRSALEASILCCTKSSTSFVQEDPHWLIVENNAYDLVESHVERA